MLGEEKETQELKIKELNFEVKLKLIKIYFITFKV